MEEMQNQEAPKMSSVENEEFELSHTDKLVGVFSEPGNTFDKISKFPPKTADWLIPILIIIVVTILAQVVMMNNPAIKLSIMEKQIEKIEKQFHESVAKGQLTQEQADEQIEKIRDRMNEGGMMQLIGTIVGVPIVTFLLFFIISGVFLLLAKFVLKGEGTYKDAMVAYGLPYYIIIIQAVVMVIAALAMNKFLSGLSIADFLGSDKTTIDGFILGKLDLFSIWFYAVVGAGLAKMFKSDNTKKYIAAVFILWLGFSLLFFALAKAVPFLSWFTGA